MCFISVHYFWDLPTFLHLGIYLFLPNYGGFEPSLFSSTLSVPLTFSIWDTIYIYIIPLNLDSQVFESFFCFLFFSYVQVVCPRHTTWTKSLMSMFIALPPPTYFTLHVHLFIIMHTEVSEYMYVNTYTP